MSRKVKPGKRQMAIALLASGYSAVDVAKHIKVRAETLSRWKKQPGFIAELEKESNNFTRNIKQRLVLLVNNSIRIINTQLDNSEEGLYERAELGMSILDQFDIHQHFPHDVLLPPAPPKPYTE